MAASIIIESKTPMGETKQKSITDVNQNATTEELINFGREITSLTPNTYQSTSLVVRDKLDTLNKRQLRTYYGFVNSANTEFTGDTINVTTTEVEAGKISNYYRIYMKFAPFTEDDLPEIEVTSSIGMGIYPTSATYPDSRWGSGSTTVQLATEDFPTGTIQPQTITVKATFKATDNYERETRTYNLIITEG